MSQSRQSKVEFALCEPLLGARACIPNESICWSRRLRRQFHKIPVASFARGALGNDFFDKLQKDDSRDQDNGF
ncbi:hypothetical protein L596_007061 [Steinernema carpocapsae]|uniref:Uncharacterized protein n=1 Tax=Steinernema carpocapsae TaxID=34508 RepID=A0A4U5P830_STECR|nr:hypothetical protein L596_007061 [Steinernema carpocapsae]